MSVQEPAPPWAGVDDVSIGRQLHDIVVPQLFVLTTGLTALRRRSSSRTDDPLVADLVETATQALSDLRAISRGESAHSVDSVASVVSRLVAETKSVGQLTECVVVLEREGDIEIPPQFGVDLVAFVWEAIANALRHGKAEHIAVSMIVADGELVVRAHDDGEWQEPTNEWGSGISGLEARVARWGGCVTLMGSDEGTWIELRVSRSRVDLGRPLR